MDDLNAFKQDVKEKTEDKPFFTFGWLESQLKSKYATVSSLISALIDKGFLVVSHTKRTPSKGDKIDEIYYKRNKDV